MDTHKKPNPHAAYLRPDAPGCPREDCVGCGLTFGTETVHPDTGTVAGRARCPGCRRLRKLDAAATARYQECSGVPSHLARRAALKASCDYETLLFVALDALYEASLQWHPSHGAKFITYAYLSVGRAVRREVDKLRSHSSRLARKRPGRDFLAPTRSMHHQYQQAADRDAGHAEVERADAEPVVRSKIDAAMSHLTPRTQYIVNRTRVDGASLATVAAELGLSHERVRQIRARAEDRLRELLVSAATDAGMNVE